MCTIHATLQHPPTITIAEIADSSDAVQGAVPAHQGAA
jgi:hypothetical protein